MKTSFNRKLYIPTIKENTARSNVSTDKLINKNINLLDKISIGKNHSTKITLLNSNPILINSNVIDKEKYLSTHHTNNSSKITNNNFNNGNKKKFNSTKIMPNIRIRKDGRGIPIYKGSKKYHVSFKDVLAKKPLVQIVCVESFKEENYNPDLPKESELYCNFNEY